MAVMVAAGVAVPALARKPPAPRCSGPFLVAGAPLLASGAAVAVDVVTLGPTARVSIDSGCQPVRARVRRTRKATAIRGVWKSCAGVRGTVRFAGAIDASCTTMTGRLVGRRPKFARRFTATRLEAGALGQLPGDPGAPAVGAITPLEANAGVPEAATELDAEGIRFPRTEIDLGLREGATVGAVNELLAGLGGRIVNMLAGVPMLLLRIPDPGSLAALDAILEQLRASPAVEFADRSYFPATRSLPDNQSSGATHLATIAHQLAIRAHGAWNAAHALALPASSPPTLVMLDNFGAGPPLSDFAVAADTADFGAGLPDPDFHGYLTLGVISAEWGGATTDRGLVTGLYPGTLPLVVVDAMPARLGSASYQQTMQALEYQLLHRLTDLPAGRRPVVNTSVGHPCDTPAEVARFCTEAFARREGTRWLRRVRGSGLEGAFVHLSAAGNVAVAGDVDARFDSPFNAARLIGTLTGADGTPLSPLENVRVVENVIHAPDGPYRPACLNAASKVHGDLAGVGTDVWSLAGPVSGVAMVSGTSLAAPQVAGLAAYLWALDPSLSPRQLLDLLERTARPGVAGTGDARCGGGVSARVVDGYGAVLAADRSLGTASVRRTILDVADAAGAPGRNGRFDEHDVRLLQSLLALQAGALDYSAYDLNGDGSTGGGGTEQMDLDLDGVYGIPSQQIEGESVDFAERNLSDQQVLCYYAYSPLFVGSTDERQTILEDKCGSACDTLEGFRQLVVQVAGQDFGGVFEDYSSTSDSLSIARSSTFLNASATASFRSLTALARLQRPDEAWPYGGVSGEAELKDQVLFTPDDATLLRQRGKLRVVVRVTSTLSARNGVSAACAQVSAHAYPWNPYNSTFFMDRVCDDDSATSRTHTLDFELVFGEVSGIQLEVRAHGLLPSTWGPGNPPPVVGGTAQANGAVEWISATILDENDAPVAGRTAWAGGVCR